MFNTNVDMKLFLEFFIVNIVFNKNVWVQIEVFISYYLLFTIQINECFTHQKIKNIFRK